MLNGYKERGQKGRTCGEWGTIDFCVRSVWEGIMKCAGLVSHQNSHRI